MSDTIERMYARNTNDRHHSVAACRVSRETLVPGAVPMRRTVAGRNKCDDYRVPGFAALSSHPERVNSGGD